MNISKSILNFKKKTDYFFNEKNIGRNAKIDKIVSSLKVGKQVLHKMLDWTPFPLLLNSVDKI